MEIKTLKNPPIKEALLEIRFNPNKNVTMNKLKEFAESMADVYSKQEPLEIQSFEFMYSKQGGQQHDFNVQPCGFKLINAQGNRIVIAAIDKFVISFLAPYTPWPDLKKTAEELYKRYLNHAPQVEIIRIGMRYINMIKLPLKENFNLQKYIKTLQPLPKHAELPDLLSRFETSITMPHKDIDCISTIRQVFLDPEDGKGGGLVYVPFVLDIDVYRRKALEVARSNEIWEIFEQMRTKKNAIFFGTLTDIAIAPFE